ncbi:MAG: Glycosyl transferase family 4 [Thermoanaerobacterales bacterium 50_218]|nr:MAG: Glycosyl transferase family 4 [Thermoanaerobacterales bacterium 50_218]HAA90447.1 hypothetical protein [Peptococcaceae bacterium]
MKPTEIILGLGLGFLLTLFFFPFFVRVFQKGRATSLNYRGEPIPTATGSVFVFVYLLFVILVCRWWESNFLIPFFVGVMIFSFLGFLDDLLGSREKRGLRGHFQALLRGELTTGGLKAIGGVLGALFVSSITFPSRPWWEVLTATLLIALSANALNLLDLRPGRAIKGFYLWFFALVLGFREGCLFLLLPLAGGLLAYAPYDFKSKVMLGDSGSNLLGASLGMVTAWVLPFSTQLVVVLLLVLFHLFTEKYSLTEVIEKNSFLRFLDNLGRGE